MTLTRRSLLRILPQLAGAFLTLLTTAWILYEGKASRDQGLIVLGFEVFVLTLVLTVANVRRVGVRRQRKLERENERLARTLKRTRRQAQYARGQIPNRA